MLQFERKLTIALACGAITLILLVVFGAYVSLSQERNLESRLRARNQLDGVNGLERALAAAESAHRAFALTGMQMFHEEFGSDRAEVAALIQRLERESFTDLPRQGQRVRSLVDLARIRLRQMDDLVATRESSGLEAARDIVAGGRGKNITDQIEKAALVFRENQDNYIGASIERDIALVNRLKWLLVGFALFNAALMAAAYSLVRHEWRRGTVSLRKLEEATEEITLLNNLSNSLQSFGSVVDARETMQHFMGRLFPDQSGVLYVTRASRSILEAKAFWGEGRDWEVLLESGECWGLRRGQVHEFWNGGDALPCKHVRGDHSSYVCVPMMAEGEAIGLLHLRFRVRAGADAVPAEAGLARRAERLAMQIGPAVASLTLRELLHEQSIRDGLTGLYNRRYLEETVGREILRARREKSNLAVVMADVDHFKRFNDTHGHQAGDEVLEIFAAHLKENIRGDDIACRYGGEEFSIILPGASAEQALERAEGLRRGAMNLQLRVGGEPLPPITASFGIAMFPRDGEAWEQLLRAADAALYRAKQQGRNRVEVASTAADVAGPPAVS